MRILLICSVLIQTANASDLEHLVTVPGKVLCERMDRIAAAEEVKDQAQIEKLGCWITPGPAAATVLNLEAKRLGGYWEPWQVKIAINGWDRTMWGRASAFRTLDGIGLTDLPFVSHQ